jgi:hypothetical protein
MKSCKTAAGLSRTIALLWNASLFMKECNYLYEEFLTAENAELTFISARSAVSAVEEV